MAMARRVLITRQAISPRLATRMVWNMVSAVISGSHSEEAEGGLRQRDTGDDVEGQAQYGAGVRGIDHAVVPQSRRRVIGAALVLVLLPDGGFERLFIRRGPILS